MARKRKSRGVEPEPVQTIEPEPEPQPEPELESEGTEQIPEGGEDAGMGEEEDEEVIEEDDEEEEEEQDGEEELKNDVVVEKNEQGTETIDKPSEEAAVSENGGEEAKEESDGEEEDEDEEEEDELEEEPLEKILEPFSKDQLTLLIKEAVSKHPEIVEHVHKLADADPAHRKIFVHGLGWEANTDTITSEFGKYGEIEDCKVVKDKITGKSKGYGFILFKHRHGARRALKQPQKLIEGRMTSCQLASAGPVQATPPAAVSAPISASPASEYTQRKIYVSNVSAELDPKKLLEFFSKFGEIEEGPLGLDKQSGKPRGFCLFVYKSIESAQKALEEPHKNYEGQILHCQKAVDGPKHSKGGYFQQHGQSQPQQHQHQHHHQGYYQHTAKKGRYAGSSGGVGHTGGHLMAPSAGPGGASMGFNPAVAPAAIGQAVAALLATQGGGLGIGNLLGGIGAGMNQQGMPPMMNNAGYGGQAGAGGYGGHTGMQGGYGSQPQLGQSGVRPHQGGPPYMGHRH